jgi:hypothetical protein
VVAERIAENDDESMMVAVHRRAEILRRNIETAEDGLLAPSLQAANLTFTSGWHRQESPGQRLQLWHPEDVTKGTQAKGPLMTQLAS